jgi:hypothetical protein
MADVLRKLLATSTLVLTVSASAAARTEDSLPGAPRAGRPVLREAIRLALPALMQQQPTPVKSIHAKGTYGKITRDRYGRLKRDVGILMGTVGGMVAGGVLGAKIEGDSCRCDDPGLKGFVIGAPIGAVLGGIAGAAIASR